VDILEFHFVSCWGLFNPIGRLQAGRLFCVKCSRYCLYIKILVVEFAMFETSEYYCILTGILFSENSIGENNILA
jgi:hypothetical protein